MDLEKFKISDNRLKYNSNKINDFVDDDMDISYQNNYNSPNLKNISAHKILSRMSNPSVIHKEGESIVPPLSLKNIGSSKNTQNNTTGKMTRTTMHTTQIRDKMALNNLKNITTAKSNQKSNVDCKYEDFNIIIANENYDKTGKTNEPVEAEKIDEHVFESKSSRSSSSSGYDYPLETDVKVNVPKPQTHPKIPMLNFGMAKVDVKGGFDLNKKAEAPAPPPAVKIPKLGLNLENIKKQDFQDEFMEKFDEYSKSWRDMIEQQKRF